ncbi:phosphate ABC transporter substrate-binding protein PstS [Sphingomonas sp. AP4-R1]|uniref:phosphate ABC transporter substrate-binding protein PstS n=1 Tax=Sphingomonas sp. AP4-R1 TaxID=2735134 RepID=UPI0014939461|nr:phosphate ABC transporter substrate-binding protein PstS [Sphingomonas sp. AP4-R1]QJU59005.1 phosphate ABC transporter substrate-binding protein PstS [Sphingomonas sp. AP4-R1]
MLPTRLCSLAALLLATMLCAAASAVTIAGAGATFPAPAYAKWAEAYRAESGVSLNYQAIGSGGGIKQVKARTVAFGATDKPLKPHELAKAGLYQFPTLTGGIVPIINLPGARPGQIRLSAEVLAGIYLGNIRRWNAPPIASLNPRLHLPNLPITVVHRSDGSGTTFLFTSYLAARSKDWSTQVGASDAVAWPTGLGGKGNDGVSAFVKQTKGAIGYVEYAYAKQNGSVVVSLQNRAGRFVMPTAATFASAAASANWLRSPGNYVLLLDEPAVDAWPIVGATFILVPRRPSDPDGVREALRFFAWAYRKGDAMAKAMDFVPIPTAIQTLLIRQWSRVVSVDGKPVFGAR